MPWHWRVIPDHLPVPAALVRLSLLMRYTRRVSSGFDVVFGVFNETDYGRKGIQDIHYPTYLRPRPAVDLRWYHAAQWPLRLYYAARGSGGGFLARSPETERDARELRLDGRARVAIARRAHHYGLSAGGSSGTGRTVGRAAQRLSGDRPLLSGKRFERVMTILARVRERGPAVTLTIVGTWDRHARRYRDRLVNQARSLGSWIEFRHNVSRDELRAVMATHRYGIHGMREEHFGMAPAELARAGCIVWVPRGGGQMEAVGHEPALMYESDDDAVAKIVRTLTDPAEQERLRERLAATSERFATANFMAQVRAIVDNFTG